MKNVVALFMAVIMMLVLSSTALAAGVMLTLDQAKKAALDYVGVNAAEATFVKAHRDWDDGRQVYEIKFYANGTEFDLDVDASTGRITDFDMEYSVWNGQPSAVIQPAPNTRPRNDGYRDWDDGDDLYDCYDDWGDRYDRFDGYDFDD